MTAEETPVRKTHPAFVLAKFSDEERVGEGFFSPESVESKVRVRLCYSPEIAEAFAILRFLLDKNEFSERGHLLSEMIITLVKNHYAAWAYRKACLLHFGAPLRFQEDLELSQRLILEEPKGFQTWDHLRFCADSLGSLDYNSFLAFLARVYEHDSKNYHAWSFRTWATGRFGFGKAEWAATDELIRKDVTNNSVWSYRHFLVRELKVDAATEFGFVREVIEGGQSANESAWFYLDDLTSKGGFSGELDEFLQGLVGNNRCNRFVLKSCLFNELRKPKESRRKGAMGEWVRLLADKHDLSRKVYWGGFLEWFDR